MNTSEQVKCYRCHQVIPRLHSLIVQTPRGKFRLCRECYVLEEKRRLSQGYETAKENTKPFKGIRIREFDPYEIMKEKEKFLENLKK